MDLNFEIFFIVVLVLTVLVVGNFLRDGESNYLEGALLIIVYIIVAIACWVSPFAWTLTVHRCDFYSPPYSMGLTLPVLRCAELAGAAGGSANSPPGFRLRKEGTKGLRRL